MPNTVFFAWQLDTPSEHNKTFIWNALTDAVQTSNPSSHTEMSPRPEVDTQGVPGSPNIIETIFNRIRSCSVFVADLSFIGLSPTGRKIPNPNVLIELGFAARSIGWDRTILVLNSAYGNASDLPSDISQHRWPIEYRLTESTKVRDSRFGSLSKALGDSLADCARHELARAAAMADALDTACLDYIAQNEHHEFIDMALPATTMRQLLMGLDHNLAIRRLIELGALRIVSQPTIGYGWTYDGRQMIQRLNVVFPNLLGVLRGHKEAPLMPTADPRKSPPL